MDPFVFETALAFALGLGLAASAGFRVFVPLLVAAVAVRSGHLSLAEGWTWLGSTPALVMFAVATVVEIAAAKVPWVDNALDTFAVPASMVAGTLLTAAFVTDLSPLLQWSLALVAGGGTAGGISGGMAVLRAGSTVTTGGLANPVVSVAETAAAFGVAVLSVFLPVAALLAAFAVVFVLVRRMRRTGAPAAA